MRKRTLLLAATAVLMLGATVVALAGFGGGNQAVVIDHGPGGGTSCTCPEIWAPVLCTAPDGSKQVFSNACFAGCWGYTACAGIEIQR